MRGYSVVLLTGLIYDLRNPLTVIRIEARLLRRGLAEGYRESVDNMEYAAIRMASWIDGVERSQAEQPGDVLLAGLTRELRDPLNAIRIQAGLLRQDLAKRYVESVNNIERCAIRMANWIDDVMDAASVQNGEAPPLVLTQTDLVQLVRDTIDEYQNARRHRLVLDARAPSIAGQFDGPRLERALDNLVANAIKYSPAGGDVQLEVSAGTDWAKVVIRDHGIGIPPQDLPHVFEPFRRGANVVGRIGGKGIGLANARHVVEQHGGALSVESAPGEGSTFIVRLPLEPTPMWN